MNHAFWLINRSPSTIIYLQIPEEIWRGESVDYATIHIFGCLAYNLVDSHKRNKLESKSKKCISIGYTAGVKGYKLCDPETRSAFVSRDVVFDEDIVMQGGSKTEDEVRGARWSFRCSS